MSVFEGLPQALRLLRLRAKLNQVELAERAKTTQQAVSVYERGPQQPSLEVLERLLIAMDADFLDLHLALFLARGEEPPLKPSLGGSEIAAEDHERFGVPLREVLSELRRLLNRMRMPKRPKEGEEED